MATDKPETDPRTVQLKMVRLSFTDGLKEKKKTANTEDAVPKHSVNLIVIKTADPADPLSAEAAKQFEANDKKIRAAIAAACEREWKNADKWKVIAEDNPKRIAYRKGERFKNQDSGEVYAGYEGNWAISGGTPGGGQRRPKLFDRRRRPVAEDDILDVMAGGYYGDVIVSFYGTDKGGAGVFTTVEAIRSREEGTRMGGGWNGDGSAFDELEDADDAFEGASDADPLG